MQTIMLERAAENRSGVLPESITTEWDESGEQLRKAKWYGILALAALAAMALSRRLGNLGYLDEVVLGGAFTTFATTAANVAVHCAFEPKYQIDSDGVTVRRRCWFTRSVRWRDVELVKVSDPDGSLWQMMSVEKLVVQPYAESRFLFHRSVAVEISKFEDSDALRRFIHNRLPHTLRNRLMVQWRSSAA